MFGSAGGDCHCVCGIEHRQPIGTEWASYRFDRNGLEMWANSVIRLRMWPIVIHRPFRVNPVRPISAPLGPNGVAGFINKPSTIGER
jgi:hypothetical protein